MGLDGLISYPFQLTAHRNPLAQVSAEDRSNVSGSANERLNVLSWTESNLGRKATIKATFLTDSSNVYHMRRKSCR
jgi:hypothetical protein